MGMVVLFLGLVTAFQFALVGGVLSLLAVFIIKCKRRYRMVIVMLVTLLFALVGFIVGVKEILTDFGATF